MSTTKAQLGIRLTEVLKRSETRNLTPTQRDRALNDALLTDVNHYRNWNPQYKNSTTQAVDGVINIPYNFRRSDYLTYGSDEEDVLYKEYDLVDQTKFFADKADQTAVITDLNGRQVIRIHDDEDQGVDVSNKTATADLGLRDAAARERLFQTFTAVSSIQGVTHRLKKVGSPTGTVTVALYATLAGVPTGSALDSKTINIDEFQDSDYYNMFFDLDYTLTAATVYATVLSGSYTVSATNYIACEYSAASVYTGGTHGTYDGATYAAGTGDLYFIIWKDKFRWQYEAELTEMTEASDETGLSRDFDEPICMLAAARLLERQSNGRDQGRTSRAFQLRYGNGGNVATPTPDSAFGLLNNIWNETRVQTKHPLRRMQNIYEKRKLSRRYPDTNATQP